MLRGIDPRPYLCTRDPLERELIHSALVRANELRLQELDYLANRIAEVLAG